MAGRSPLYPYINSRVLFPGVPTIASVNGRFVETTTEGYVVKAWMKRIQYAGVSSGSKRIPLESQLDGLMMPGASGDQFYYRGYSLEYAQVDPGYDLETSDESSLVFLEVKEQYPWMKTGTEVPFQFGNDPQLISRVQRSSGIFGGIGIDEIIYKEIAGVQLQLTGGEVQN
jgi:hypothetical protein